MFNKELLMGNNGGKQPVALTVGRGHIGTTHTSYGYVNGRIGLLEPRPFWGNYTYLNELRYDGGSNYTMCSMTDRSVDVMVYVSGYQGSPISSGGSILGDPFSFRVKNGQTVYLTFDPPPDGYLDPKTHKPI